jgi:hypothetical protein
MAGEQQEPTQLTHAALQQVKQLILAGGHRCTFSNMYNHNPCARVGELDLYLIPDPGPDGHPQWNLNSELPRGDFHTLLVVPLNPDRSEARASFLPGAALAVKPATDPTAERLLSEATRTVLDGTPLTEPETAN